MMHPEEEVQYYILQDRAEQVRHEKILRIFRLPFLQDEKQYHPIEEQTAQADFICQ